MGRWSPFSNRPWVAVGSTGDPRSTQGGRPSGSTTGPAHRSTHEGRLSLGRGSTQPGSNQVGRPCGLPHRGSIPRWVGPRVTLGPTHEVTARERVGPPTQAGSPVGLGHPRFDLPWVDPENWADPVWADPSFGSTHTGQPRHCGIFRRGSRRPQTIPRGGAIGVVHTLHRTSYKPDTIIHTLHRTSCKQDTIIQTLHRRP